MIEFVFILLLIVTKAFGDAFNYLYNTKGDKVYGIFYHIDYAILVALAVLALSFKSNIELYILLISAILLYFGLFSPLYNLLTKRNIMYIGSTDITDILLSKVFNNPFRKWVLLCIRFASFWAGQYLLFN